MVDKDLVETTSAPLSNAWDLFDTWFTEWPFARRLLPEPQAMRPDMLRVEEYTDGDQRVVRVEIPGIDPDNDVDLRVVGHQLHVRAERRQRSTVEEAGEYRSEFRYGSLARSVPLPVEATETDVKASYKDGILEIRVPVDRELAAVKKIPVERA